MAQAGWSRCISLTPSTFQLHRTELNPFGSHCGSRKAWSLPYQALCVFSFALDSSITSHWVGKGFRAKEADKSFPGTWRWDVPRCFCRVWMGRVSPSSQQQAVATGYHRVRTWYLNGFAFQLRKVFIAWFLKARERQSVCAQTHAQKCRGGEWAKGNLA